MNKASGLLRWLLRAWMPFDMVLRVDDGDGTGDDDKGGDQPKPVTAEDARTFLKDYTVDGVDLAALPDDKVVAWHGKIKPLVDRGTGDWAPDWRAKLAKGDDKALKQLERYASPVDVWTKARALEQRMSSGELRSVLPKDATEDQVKAWRTENGIPEAPDKYELKLKDGLVIGEDDKPVIEGFLKAAHGANYTTAQANAAAEWYFGMKEQAAQAQAERDVEAKTKGEDILRGEFGGEFRKNINLVTGLLGSLPKEAGAALMNGRAADGTPFMSNPEIIRGLLDWAKMINPTGTSFDVGDTGGLMKTMEEEKAGIDKIMREDRPRYNKDEKMQARWRELDEAITKAKARDKLAA